jgi:predicted ABC-type ATPase
MSRPRLRIFADPNGSGKSTLKEILPSKLLGDYINADQILSQIRANGQLDFSQFNLTPETGKIADFFCEHPLSRKASLLFPYRFENNTLVFDTPSECNAYHASVIADYLRHELLHNKCSFTFETVMSSEDKIDFMKKAKESGYRICLYFIATVDPVININRVKIRVSAGGHDVPRDKIVSRYHRSIKLLRKALPLSDRAYLFDNSGSERVWIAEITDGHEVEIHSDLIPPWVNSLFQIDEPIKDP